MNSNTILMVFWVGVLITFVVLIGLKKLIGEWICCTKDKYGELQSAEYLWDAFFIVISWPFSLPLILLIHFFRRN